MEPKFQSTFIPKGLVSAGLHMPIGVRAGNKDIFSFLATLIFTISLVLAGGVFLYKFYLNYRIAQMGTELEAARAALAPETVTELIRLNGRIISTAELLKKHQVISPVFDFLETSTPRSVRYTDFDYSTDENGVELNLRGEARSYAALAFLSQVFNKSTNFKNTVFSDLRLDQTGNVIFSLTTNVEENLLSYERLVEKSAIAPPRTSIPVSTSTPSAATSTPKATSTQTSN